LLITKDGTDTDVYLLLSGRVGIEINGVEVAIRQAGTHVGEMAAIDPAALRSANVRALDATVALKLTDDAFNELAKANPEMWRRLAIELADRLRQRTKFFRTPNDRPHLFIGSSTEMLPIAQAIQTGLSHEDIAVTVWTDGVFRASRDAITNLLAVADRTDFAVLIVGPDDVVISRGAEQAVARDNVIFELGLFIGAAGRDRTFLVKPRGVDLRLPSDLLGLEPLQFDADESKSINSRVGPVCAELRDYISTQGVR
jgi:predicted nucleotide-binding protein